MDQIDFSEFFSTKTESTEFLSGLTEVTDKIFQTDFHVEKALSEQFGINKSDRLLAIMRENTINTQSRDSIKKFLEKMQESIAALPVLSLTIGFDPKDKTLKSLSEWFLINVKKQVVFDFSIDPKVVAGATLTYNGKFFDFSIRPVFGRILKIYTDRLTNRNTQRQEAVTVQSVQQNVNSISRDSRKK
jgi:hypothetical protein